MSATAVDLSKVTIDSRLGGTPRYLVGAGWKLMRVPEEIRKCVCFVGFRMADGREKFAGTAFFVARSIKGTDQFFTYAVTARHVIDGIRDRGFDTVLLRVNDKTGARWMGTPISRWVMHPDGPSVDVAVLTVILEKIDHRLFNLRSAISEDVIKRSDIGVGTEVFITGLFSNHPGENRNIPIVRIGNIAAMQEEKVRTREIGPIDAYLIECRSLGGLSGSPVFARTDPVSRTPDGTGISLETGSAYLLGLVHGHYEGPTLASDTADDVASSPDRINVGIAIVVPMEKILETINQKYMRDLEAPLEEWFRAERLPTPD